MSRWSHALRATFTRHELWVGGLLLALTAALVAFQYSTLEKFAVVPPGTGLATLQEWARAGVGLSWGDAVLPLSMLAIAGALVSLEWGDADRLA